MGKRKEPARQTHSHNPAPEVPENMGAIERGWEQGPVPTGVDVSLSEFP